MTPFFFNRKTADRAAASLIFQTAIARIKLPSQIPPPRDSTYCPYKAKMIVCGFSWVRNPLFLSVLFSYTSKALQYEHGRNGTAVYYTPRYSLCQIGKAGEFVE